MGSATSTSPTAGIGGTETELTIANRDKSIYLSLVSAPRDSPNRESCGSVKMIYLFSDRAGPLRDGATFMSQKNRDLHPGMDNFYRVNQQGEKHKIIAGLGAKSKFDNVDCRLASGEVAIVIGHGGDSDKIYDEDRADVTTAASLLLAKIAKDNSAGGYVLFLAACGGGVRQPKGQTSLLTSLVKGVPVLAQQLLDSEIACWGYTAEAGLVALDAGLPADRQGTHIYGVLRNNAGVSQHCGYDKTITNTVRRTPDGTYFTIYFSPALYPLAAVIDWAEKGYKPDMRQKFPNLFHTVMPTQ